MSRSAATGHTGLTVHGSLPGAQACSVQPHGLLLVVHAPVLRIVQASTSAGVWLQRPLDTLLLATLHDLGGDLDAQLRQWLADGPPPAARPLRCTLGQGASAARFEGSMYRAEGGAVVIELEPLGAASPDMVDHASSDLLLRLGDAVQRFGEAASVVALAAAAAGCVRALTGYDHVIVSEFGTEGQGGVTAEALDPRRTPLPGVYDPLTEASPRARGNCLRQRLRVLVDVNALPSELLPRLPPGSDGAFDLAHSQLRSTSPQRAQRLRAQGVAASVVTALVCEGRLWGLITCHHARPRNLRHGTRAALELLAEAFGTRVLALENHARAQALAEVRRLEQRLLEAISTEGDWHAALLRHQRMLLQPLQASGALVSHEGQTLGCGAAPEGAAADALLQWLRAQALGTVPLHCDALDPGHPARAVGVCGVLAVRLSQTQPDCLVWLRTAHADGAQPWTRGDIALAAAYGAALADVILQVNAVRLLIAESHLAQVRSAVAGSHDAVVVADVVRGAFYANAAFHRLAGRRRDEIAGPDALAALFTDPGLALRIIGQVRAEQRPWRGELALQRPDGSTLPVAVRAEPVPGSDHTLLGTVFIFQDISEARRADAARARLDSALTRTGRDAQGADEGRDLMGALIASASLAAMDIAEGGAPAAVAPLLAEVEASTARATVLLQRIRRFGTPSAV